MPVYEYECSKGHLFEVEQRISDAPVARCRVCRAKAHRLISRTSFILKGGGWYADGYGSGKGKSESKPASTPSSGGAAGDSKKSDSQPSSSSTSKSSSKPSPAGASAS